ncbi:Uncharacterized protein GBIM_10245 [Gryllus bimaculatus]|nr:Uncharacterized protein GBIM_10245 [Gryllus bimaculatus]
MREDGATFGRADAPDAWRCGVELDVVELPPLWVRLLGENRPLSADNEYQVQCEAVGTRPPPEMTWWKGGVPLRHAIERVSK